MASRMECAICFTPNEDGPPLGVSCRPDPPEGGDRGHYLCRDCLQHYVRDKVEADQLIRREGHTSSIPCPGHEPGINPPVPCTSEGWSMAMLIEEGRLDHDVLRAFILGVDHAIEVLANQQGGRQEPQQLEAGDEGRFDRIQALVFEALNICCPRCGVVRIDHDACEAVTCDNCGQDYCFLCFERVASRRDAHAHVIRRHQRLFGGGQRLREHHRLQKVRQIQNVLAPLQLEEQVTFLRRDNVRRELQEARVWDDLQAIFAARAPAARAPADQLERHRPWAFAIFLETSLLVTFVLSGCCLLAANSTLDAYFGKLTTTAQPPQRTWRGFFSGMPKVDGSKNLNYSFQTAKELRQLKKSNHTQAVRIFQGAFGYITVRVFGGNRWARRVRIMGGIFAVPLTYWAYTASDLTVKKLLDRSLHL